jgi:hypothetical protein
MLDRFRQRLVRPTAPRSLSSYVARTLIPRTLLFGSLSAALLVGNAMAVDPLAAPADSAPDALPTWTAEVAAAHPDCVDAHSWPAGRPAEVVVGFSFADDAAEEIPFDSAWARNHNASEADDVWVLGVCP